MPWRTYTITQKYIRVDGTVSRYKVKNKKWIKSNSRYKPQKRGLEKESLYSKIFGLLELYNRKEQQSLICPSGYSISQCFNVMRKLWYAYRKSLYEKNIQRIEKYARAIQNVQKDMGIPTASFPHLGLYGDSFVLNNKKGNRIVNEDHSALKKKQEDYEKWQVENSKKNQKLLIRPNRRRGQHVKFFVDDKYPFQKVDCQETVPNLLEPDEEAGEKILTIIDDIPFQNHNQNEQEILQNPNREKGESIVTFADDVSPHQIIDNEETVPDLLKHRVNEEQEEEEIVMIEDIPFQNHNQND